jgi:acyl-CoA-binding protein
MSFEKAIADSKKLTSKPSNEELLDLYGTPGPGHPATPGDHPTDSTPALFKIANGEDISAAPAPGMFDLKVRRVPKPTVAPLPIPLAIATQWAIGYCFASERHQHPANNISRRVGQGKEERLAEEG